MHGLSISIFWQMLPLWLCVSPLIKTFRASQRSTTWTTSPSIALPLAPRGRPSGWRPPPSVKMPLTPPTQAGLQTKCDWFFWLAKVPKIHPPVQLLFFICAHFTEFPRWWYRWCLQTPSFINCSTIQSVILPTFLQAFWLNISHVSIPTLSINRCIRYSYYCRQPAR